MFAGKLSRLGVGAVAAATLALGAPMAFADAGGSAPTSTTKSDKADRAKAGKDKKDGLIGCQHRNRRADLKGDNRSATGKENGKDEAHRSDKVRKTCDQRIAERMARKAANGTTRPTTAPKSTTAPKPAPTTRPTTLPTPDTMGKSAEHRQNDKTRTTR